MYNAISKRTSVIRTCSVGFLEGRVRTSVISTRCVGFEITAFIAGNCVFCCFNSEFTKKIIKITNITDKNANIFVILSVLYVISLILFVNSLLKQQSTQLPAMKAVISYEKF
jgi:hypothetical protein